MGDSLKPETPEQVLDALRWAAAEEASLSVVAGRSKGGLGRPVSAAWTLDLSAVSGITGYEPEELVLTARAATPLAEIESALAERGQQLAFEPADWSALLSQSTGRSKASGHDSALCNMTGTLGGTVACNLSGPRRIYAGAARDHVLGFHAVSGRGEEFKSGGRVVKNVTGFDLSKLISGSYGTLAVMTDVTVRALPAAEETRTVVVTGCLEQDGVNVMTRALQSPYEVSGAAHLPADIALMSSVDEVSHAGGSVTAIRLEGPAPSVSYRAGRLVDLVSGFGETWSLNGEASHQFWRDVRDVRIFTAVTGGTDGGGEHGRSIWRLSVPPSEGPRVVAEILFSIEGSAFYDWGGGLVWLALKTAGDPADTAHQAIVRAALASVHGHATLVSAPDAVRAAADVFQPQPGPLADLTRRVKAGFDPSGILNPGRMYAHL